MEAAAIIEKLKETLRMLKEDCEMALSGDWEVNDEGFEAMIESINKALAL